MSVTWIYKFEHYLRFEIWYLHATTYTPHLNLISFKVSSCLIQYHRIKIYESKTFYLTTYRIQNWKHRKGITARLEFKLPRTVLLFSYKFVEIKHSTILTNVIERTTHENFPVSILFVLQKKNVVFSLLFFFPCSFLTNLLFQNLEYKFSVISLVFYFSLYLLLAHTRILLSGYNSRT